MSAALRGGFFVASLLFSSPQDLNRVLFNHAVGGDEDHVFQIGLGDQQSIKRIMMMSWESEDRQRMLVGDWKRAESLIGHPARNIGARRFRKMQFARLRFDGNLP